MTNSSDTACFPRKKLCAYQCSIKAWKFNVVPSTRIPLLHSVLSELRNKAFQSQHQSQTASESNSNSLIIRGIEIHSYAVIKSILSASKCEVFDLKMLNQLGRLRDWQMDEMLSKHVVVAIHLYSGTFFRCFFAAFPSDGNARLIRRWHNRLIMNLEGLLYLQLLNGSWLLQIFCRMRWLATPSKVAWAWTLALIFFACRHKTISKAGYVCLNNHKLLITCRVGYYIDFTLNLNILLSNNVLNFYVINV